MQDERAHEGTNRTPLIIIISFAVRITLGLCSAVQNPSVIDLAKDCKRKMRLGMVRLPLLDSQQRLTFLSTQAREKKEQEDIYRLVGNCPKHFAKLIFMLRGHKSNSVCSRFRGRIPFGVSISPSHIFSHAVGSPTPKFTAETPNGGGRD